MSCYFCQHNTKEIDYKDVDLLKRFISASAKIKPREKTGTCSKHQRVVKNAVKKARSLGLLPTSRN
jgi:small subunit ribosomal protein S18